MDKKKTKQEYISLHDNISYVRCTGITSNKPCPICDMLRKTKTKINRSKT